MCRIRHKIFWWPASGDLLGVFNGGTEDDGSLALHILEPGVHDELIALRHINLALQVPDVVLDTVEPNLGQIDVGMDADHRTGTSSPISTAV